MNVCFFRHGLAAEPGAPGVADDARTLTEEGRRKTRAAARGLKKLNLGLDTILTSPLPRALETAEIVADVLGLPRPQPSDRLLPGASAAQVLEALKDFEGKSPIFVGHEPVLSAAVSLLVASSDAGDFQLKKAGMAYAKVQTLTPHPRGSLHLLMTPAALRRLAR